MGTVAELFRTYPDVHRRNHPISSVAARGPNAQALVADVPLDNRLGPDSAYGRLVRLGDKVARLGAPYQTMSLLHLSLYLIGWGEPVVKSACIMIHGRCEWVSFNDLRFPHEWAQDCVAEMVHQGVTVQRPFDAFYLFLIGAAEAINLLV